MIFSSDSAPHYRMLSMTARPPFSLVAAFLMVGFLVCFDSQDANGQGLFRRLQSRIQSRIENGPRVGPLNRQVTPSQPRTATPGSQPIQPIPGSRSSANGAAGMSGAGNPGASSGNASSSGANVRNPASGRNPSAADPRFGGSILSQGTNSSQSNGNATQSVASRPTLGIKVMATSEGSKGLEVAAIRPGSRAGEAGLKVGDLIVAVDGTPTPNVQVVGNILQRKRPGDSVTATVRRGERDATVRLPLMDAGQLAELESRSKVAASSAAAPSGAAPVQAGPTAKSFAMSDFGAAVSPADGRRGVVVGSVRPDSPAGRAGLKVGDRVVSIEGRLIVDPASFEREITRTRIGDQVSVNVVRDDTLNTYDVNLRGGADSDTGSADAVASSSEPSTEKDGGSVLGGIGSVLGGLFGGPAGDGAKGKEEESDSMAFDDGEPIRQVGFDQETTRQSDASAEKKKATESDPPSVEVLTPPPADKIEDKSDGEGKESTIRELRDEVERLRERLKELESDLG